MSDRNKVRLAHELLDEVNAREDLTPEQVGVLRSFLPERPKQKTLEDVYREVCNAWYRTDGDAWKADAFGELEDWLYWQCQQLKGLIDAQPIAPSLPEGMRLADHPKYGRVVVSPDTGYGSRTVFASDADAGSGVCSGIVDPYSLTFIDAEPVAPAKPSHPEFLETAADYEKAPEGTIVGDYLAPSKKKPEVMWQKLGDGKWWFAGGSHYASMPDNTRNVIRWGWGE